MTLSALTTTREKAAGAGRARAGREAASQVRERFPVVETMLWWFGHTTVKEVADQCHTTRVTARATLEAYAEEVRPAGWRQVKPPAKKFPVVYRVDDDFKPHDVTTPSAAAFLAWLATRQRMVVPLVQEPDNDMGSDALLPRLDKLDRRFIDALPELPRESVKPDVLRTILRAIGFGVLPPALAEKQQRALRVRYHRPGRDPEELVLHAHALTHDTFRWALRARAAGTDAYRDYVLERFTKVEIARGTPPGDFAAADRAWTAPPVKVWLGPNPGFTDRRAAKRIADEYKMLERSHEGRPWWGKPFEMRECFVVYFLKRLQLEEPLTQKAPHQQPIVVLNRAEVAGWIPADMEIPLRRSGAG